jgi:uncharacterized membrane protein (UPF0127 family)
MKNASRALICLGLMLMAGCSQEPTVAPLRTVSMKIGRETFILEIADTAQLRETGLMNRKAMAADHGMLFVFEHRQFLRFWMRNTLIPLDILYVDADGRVATIRQMKPLDETGIPSGEAVLYAIELNEGAAARAGVKQGDVLQLPKEYAPRKAD